MTAPGTAAPPARDGEPALILFDGVCNLCNGAVLFVLDRDPRARFRFAPLQGDEAARRLAAHGPEAARMRAALSSIVLLEDGALHTRSTAALRIARRLRWPWPLLYAAIAIPAPIRDLVYDWVARNRYRWFGREDACRVPTPTLRARFLD